MEGLCELRLDQITLPGTHNSGSGFNGHMYHWGGGIALSKIWRNQQWDFTRQLEHGIRYFGIDTCYVDKDYDDWWTKGAWACHMGFGTAAYAGPVKKILTQINDWMNKPENSKEVIIIKFGRDVEVENAKQIYEDILNNLNDFGWKPSPATLQAKNLTTNADFGKNYRWPTLKKAIETNQRVFLFMSEKLLKYMNWSDFRNNLWVVEAEREIKITWPEILEFLGDCSDVVPKTEKNCAKFQNRGLLELDVFGSSIAVSTWLMQSSCDKYIQQAMDQCYAKREPYQRTVNAVLADWVDRAKSPNSVIAVARKQNELNIDMYKKNGRK